MNKMTASILVPINTTPATIYKGVNARTFLGIEIKVSELGAVSLSLGWNVLEKASVIRTRGKQHCKMFNPLPSLSSQPAGLFVRNTKSLVCQYLTLQTKIQESEMQSVQACRSFNDFCTIQFPWEPTSTVLTH